MGQNKTAKQIGTIQPSSMGDVAEIVERVKRNDMLAMKLLYERSADAMLNVSMRMVQNRADAQDILQESYLTSFQKIQNLKDPSSYFAWLKRIVVNNSLSVIKKHRRFEDLNQINELEDSQETSGWYENIPMSEIKKAIDVLPEGSRAVFTLYLLEGYKHREIAEMMGISESTSKSQYRYALKLLKENLVNKIN